jgi:acetyl-CoA C-acetyltransferase/acetyl-CoA acyltransferase
MESITTAAERIFSGRSQFVLAGGCESMSHIPLLYGPQMTELFAKLMKAKTLSDKLGALANFRLSFLKPIIGLQLGLTDPTCGLNMGQTAEVLAREFSITRGEQDRFALRSHQRALEAQSAGFFEGEIHPTIAPQSGSAMMSDEGPNPKQSLERLQKLKPYFDRQAGTVTVGNACPVSDGAAMVLLCKESVAKERGWSPLGYMRHWEYAGLEPERMGLGPVYATAKLLKQGAYKMEDFESIELNEAFAAQVIANQRAFASKRFGQDVLGLGVALGALDPEKMNPNGGAIALGHPVGTTGTRLVITLLRHLKRENKNCGLATLCVGGGQGAAMVLEVT